MRDVGLDVDLARSRRHDMRIVPHGMAVGGDRGNAGDDLLAFVIGPQPLHHLAGKDAAVVPEQLLDAAFGGTTHLAVIHPELVFRRRHQNLGVGKGERIVRLQQTVHVIAVVVRNDDGIDRLGVDAGRGQIGQELTDPPLARIERRFAQTGVDDDELLSGVDDDRIKGG